MAKGEPSNRLWLLSLLALITVSALPSGILTANVAANGAADGSFGFSDLQVFRLSSAGGPWHSADLDDDGDIDLVVWDGNQGELIQLLRDPDVTGYIHTEGGNTLVDPDGWRRTAVPVRASVEAIASGDVDGDGHLDLILSCPDANRIEVRWGSASPDRFRSDFRLRLREIAHGDRSIDFEPGQDRQTVIRILSKEGIHEVRNLTRSGVPDIETLPGTAVNPIALHRADIDGDGIHDLLTVSSASADRRHPLRVRPGSAEGWSSEILLEAEDSRLLGLATTDEGVLLMMSDKNRPVLRGLRMERGRGRQVLPSPEVFPLSPKGIGAGSLAIGDIDGDGDPDVVISDAQSSLLRPFWNRKGHLTPGSPSATLKKPKSLLIHHQEVIITSPEEGGGGKSTAEQGGFSFPALLEGEQISTLIGIAGSGESFPLVSLHRGDEKSRTYQLIQWPLESGVSTTFESVREPSALHVFPAVDATQITMVEIPFETPRFFRIQAGQFETIQIPATVESGGSVQRGPSDQLLIAREGRCRIITIEGLTAQVERQIDAPGGSAKLVAAVPIRLPDQRAQLALIDAGQGLIHLCDKTGVYASVEGPFQKVKQAITTDLDGDGFDEILMLTDRALLVIRPTDRDWISSDVFSRRSEQQNSRSTAMASGDLDGDRIDDLVVVDGVRGELEILAGGTDLFRSVLSFPVFEKKLFRGGGRGIEPRRVMIRDFDGDGLQDVAILVHDRLIIYPQDSNDGAN
ncbi:MAG: VCBS repeat-containing protein [Planctomycetota bacterium]|nr:VCBS repeat-containing protein [Planctomycetota bacterium]